VPERVASGLGTKREKERERGPVGSRGSFPGTRLLVLSELMRGDIRTRIARTSFNAQEPRHAAATRGSKLT
jgi:hypothetical protein